jgi:prepilin-type N-terminal cleavage/methylation domain-containing protein/prepilin-type processing-associated H-X9-DG protein
MHARARFRWRGFTLVEILIAIAIISVLLALLLVAVQNARATARKMACQNNMRQWAFAMLNYAQAHQGYLPRRGQGVQITTQLVRPDDWFNALPPFLEDHPLTELINANAPPRPGDRSIWMCPEFTERAIPTTDPTSDQTSDAAQPHYVNPNALYFAYGMNMWLSTQKSLKPDHIDKVGVRKTMVFLAEGNGAHCSLLPSAPSAIHQFSYFSPVARHHDMTNLAFLDGHIASYQSDYVGCGVGLPERPDICWIVPDSPWPGP